MVGREDISISYKILDDQYLRASGFQLHMICVFYALDKDPLILANVESWR